MPVHVLLRQVPKPYCPVPELSHWKQLMGKGEEMLQENINPQHCDTTASFLCQDSACQKQLAARSVGSKDVA